MKFLTVIVALLLSFFSTAIMSYIALTTGVGPWIEATLVLAGMLIYYAFKNYVSHESRMRSLGLTTAAGGIGGILATGCGFSFPTLFFLNPQEFSSLLSNPLSFVSVLGSLALAAGSLGLVMATLCEHSLIVTQQLPFPMGALVYKMISAQDSLSKAWSLATGFIGTQLYLITRMWGGILSEKLLLIPKFSYGAFSFPQIVVPTDQLPLFWAIGFVTGHVIAIPLLWGFLAKILCIQPLHYIYPRISGFLYEHGLSRFISQPGQTISFMDFTIAFCSGMVLYGAAMGFLELPKLAKSATKFFSHARTKSDAKKEIPWILGAAALILNIGFLTFFHFSPMAQFYLITFTLVCTYQMMLIAGKIGIAPLGRFATFVMVPGMLLFGYTSLQVTLVATYVEIAGGVGCDALFGRKMAQLAHIPGSTIQRYQWLGLIVSSICVGFIFWIFITHFGIGNEPGALAASKAASRALLIDVKNFDTIVLLLGVVFGYFLKFTKVNTALLLGGILMPPEVSLMLILGGWSTYLVKNKEDYYPFWSGVFAANSLWMLVKAFL